MHIANGGITRGEPVDCLIVPAQYSDARSFSDGLAAVEDLNGWIYIDRGGAVVNVIADVWHGFPMMAHTGAARAGVDNLTKSLATEWGRYGVRVNAVAPGVIRTTGLDHYPEPVKAMIHAAKRFNQTHRLGTAAEVSAAILFLLSPAAAFITGETLRVDGGSSIYSPFLPPQEHGKLPPFDDG